MKDVKNLKGLYCLNPFTNMEISSFHTVSCCCSGWMPEFNAGDIECLSLNEIWNSDSMQKVRQSILDGTYNFCDKEACPYLTSENFKLYTENELKTLIDSKNDSSIKLDDSLLMIKDLSPWINNILEGKVVLENLPATFNLCYDETCNLKCPSCRPINAIYAKGEEYERRLKIHKKLFTELEHNGFENIRHLIVTGAGDPFASLIYSNLLFTFDGRKYPLLKFNIMTNALLLTPEVWNKMNKIHSNIESIYISVDAVNSKTYKDIRVNGNFEILSKNLEFLGKMRKENTIKYLIFAFVVQKKNYKEMADFVAMAKKYNVDQIIFNALADWKSWEHDEFCKNAVCNPNHSEYHEFLEILKNPIFEDPIVNLGNITNHRIKALNS